MFRKIVDALRMVLLLIPVSSCMAQNHQVEVGTAAPEFELKNQSGVAFKLASRRGVGWTVLYFYPKADTPGCSKEACAFRDAIDQIRILNTEVYGISKDTVESQSTFHKKYQLKFDLLADSEGEVIEKFGVALPVIGVAKRWTFILDPELTIRDVRKDVDPALEPAEVSNAIKALQEIKPK